MGRGLSQSDPRISDPAALARWKGKERIQVELADLGNLLSKARRPQQRLYQGLKIDRRMFSISGEQVVGFDFSDSLCGVAIGERHDTELNLTKISTWIHRVKVRHS